MALDACRPAFGDDVYLLTGEPYAAAVAHDRKFAKECMDAAEAVGFARDLCSYMRIYWGGMHPTSTCLAAVPQARLHLPDPDLLPHSKWYQHVAHGKQVPQFYVDVGVGPYKDMNEPALDYVTNQLNDGIEFLEKSTGRKSTTRSSSRGQERNALDQPLGRHLRPEQGTPAPLDEKTMYSLYVLATLAKSSQWCADFYDELYDEVKDRVRAVSPPCAERKPRMMSDTSRPGRS